MSRVDWDGWKRSRILIKFIDEFFPFSRSELERVCDREEIRIDKAWDSTADITAIPLERKQSGIAADKRMKAEFSELHLDLLSSRIFLDYGD